MTVTKADLYRSKLALSLVRGELLQANRSEAAAGLETASLLVDDAIGDDLPPSEATTRVEVPKPEQDPLARHTGVTPGGPPVHVTAAMGSAPVPPVTATVSGSGGPQNSYEVRMTPHPRAVGSCPDCGGQLNHAPTCPKLAPPAPKTP